MGWQKKLKKATKKLSLKNVAKTVKDTVKAPWKAVSVGLAKVVGGVGDAVGLKGTEAMDNLQKKGLKAFGLGQMLGGDRAKLLANREVAAAEAAAGANPDDPAGVGADMDPLAMANSDDISIRKARRKSMIEAQKRGGRQSTMLSDKSEY